MLGNRLVAAAWERAAREYPRRPPFHPPELYAETRKDVSPDTSNTVYPLVRASLQGLGLDAARYGSPDWNPLGDLVKPGQLVVIKPNLVKHFHPLGDEAYLSTVTHASVIRPLLDYVGRALNRQGRIVVADTPLDYADFDLIVRLTGLADVVEYCRRAWEIPIELLDLREKRIFIDEASRRREMDLAGDPRGYACVDLAGESALSELESQPQNYYTLADDTVDHLNPLSTTPGQTNRYHFPGHHEYKVSRTILSADTIIYVPKLKTHKKAGVTLSLKNSIGIVGGKVYMPHHRPGGPPQGDAFPQAPASAYVWKRNLYLTLMRRPPWGPRLVDLVRSTKRSLLRETPMPAEKKKEQEPIEWGDWSGNDTIWRSILDLNRILIYADPSGRMHPTPQRKYLSLLDGIVGQEGEGPMTGQPRPSGLIIAGTNPVAVDLAAVRAMDFDWHRIPLMVHAREVSRYPLWTGDQDIELRVSAGDGLPHLRFKTPRGWRGIHLQAAPEPPSDQVPVLP